MDYKPSKYPKIKKGSHIYVWKKLYFHHGIYDGKGNVIQYSGLSNGLQGGPVNIIPLAKFAGKSKIHIREYPKSSMAYSENEIVERAFSRLGENLYDVQTNNCEHFCAWVVTGKHHSGQVELVENAITLLSPKIGNVVKGVRIVRELLKARKIKQNWQKKLKK